MSAQPSSSLVQATPPPSTLPRPRIPSSYWPQRALNLLHFLLRLLRGGFKSKFKWKTTRSFLSSFSPGHSRQREGQVLSLPLYCVRDDAGADGGGGARTEGGGGGGARDGGGVDRPASGSKSVPSCVPSQVQAPPATATLPSDPHPSHISRPPSNEDEDEDRNRTDFSSSSSTSARSSARSSSTSSTGSSTLLTTPSPSPLSSTSSSRSPSPSPEPAPHNPPNNPSPPRSQPQPQKAHLSANPMVYPIPPSCFERFQRGVRVHLPPSGWKEYTHPLGAMYFYHEKYHILTEANLHDAPTYQATMGFHEGSEGKSVRNQDALSIKNKESSSSPPTPSLDTDTELVLDITPNGDANAELVCGYYLVSHARRLVYWFDDMPTAYLCPAGMPVLGMGHLRHQVEAEYWTHWDLFPHLRTVTGPLIAELRDQVTHGVVGVMTSFTSTVPFALQDLQALHGLVDQIEKNAGYVAPGSACAIGRFMRELAQHRFLNLHGQPGARLSTDQSPYHGLNADSDCTPRSLLLTLVSPLFFFAPEAQLQTLEQVCKCGLINRHSWAVFQDELITQWQEHANLVSPPFLLLPLFSLSPAPSRPRSLHTSISSLAPSNGTVLLTANVGLLAIQSVDNAGSNRSSTQIASYMSLITSLGCVILSLILQRQHRRPAFKRIDQAVRPPLALAVPRDRYHTQTPVQAEFIQRQSQTFCGLETLALLYTLPYALLLWAMLSFLSSCSFLCFWTSSTTTRATIGSTWTLVAVLVAWCLLTSWESRGSPERFVMAFRNSAIPRLVPMSMSGMREGWGKMMGVLSEGIRGVREADVGENV
ncbi:uncharacterized protein STEHIDRAFT_158011 [Stereum hirsutum FP-91666 SS1]|uniref:uncharacterized protein n=1 Tax=Stereum hirsutum (strain FP-91666) TaxID=721885 RepID=UPI000444A824|nr:uncharacterized protein STEHIDRAFT_158011 [Stereum hirsutum FP-91666 SS1]EIM85377.1 hypothetical protein STEHIDRAFT_158011 [Stereum hirsutum FP-91666 SS1]